MADLVVPASKTVPAQIWGRNSRLGMRKGKTGTLI